VVKGTTCFERERKKKWTGEKRKKKNDSAFVDLIGFAHTAGSGTPPTRPAVPFGRCLVFFFFVFIRRFGRHPLFFGEGGHRCDGVTATLPRSLSGRRTS